MNNTQGASLIGKKYLYILVLMIPIVIWNLLFNPDLRVWLGFSKKTESSIFTWKKTVKVASQPDASSALHANRDAMEAFASSFIDSEVVVIAMPTNEGWLDEIRTAEKMEEEHLRASATGYKPWPVHIKGVFLKDGVWCALIANEYCGKDRILLPENPECCAYQILSVGKRCVWLYAFPYKKETVNPPSEMPQIRWPDVACIEIGRASLADARQVPRRVVFANGARLKEGDYFTISSDQDVVYSVVNIWDRGACFEVRQSGSAACRIACMLLVSQ